MSVFDLVSAHYCGLAERNERMTNVELKNQLLQITVKARLREYIPAIEVRRFMAKMIGGAKARALAIPSAMAPKAALMIDAVEIDEMLHGAVRDMLVEMEKGEWSIKDFSINARRSPRHQPPRGPHA